MEIHAPSLVKTRSRVLRAGFGSASADKFLSESVRILAERLTLIQGTSSDPLPYQVLPMGDLSHYGQNVHRQL